MYVIVAYDISNDYNRTKAMKKLLGLGFKRLQKSVYVRRGSKGDAKDALRAIQKYIDDGDKVFIIVVSDKELREAFLIEGKVA